LALPAVGGIGHQLAGLAALGGAATAGMLECAAAAAIQAFSFPSASGESFGLFEATHEHSQGRAVVERSRSAAAVVLRIYGLVISPAMCATA
jgi:hypothetical protein